MINNDQWYFFILFLAKIVSRVSGLLKITIDRGGFKYFSFKVC